MERAIAFLSRYPYNKSRSKRFVPRTQPFFAGIMKIVVWNCRGAGSRDFRRHAKELLRNHKPEVFILIETRVRNCKAEKIIRKLGLGGCFKSPPEGISGGIWILWNLDLHRAAKK